MINNSFFTTAVLEDAKQSLTTALDWVRWSATQMELAEVYFGHGTDNSWDEAVALVLQTLQMPFGLP
ncbi:MAG: hypothetical protein V2I33_01270, partial [Kangiellaceae bacterium]|nr:hypothetical protein [Kangiellaceae bacterium]